MLYEESDTYGRKRTDQQGGYLNPLDRGESENDYSGFKTAEQKALEAAAGGQATTIYSDGSGGNESAGDEEDQGGAYTINQVLKQYGYPSREEYLFPRPTLSERLLNFLRVSASTQDLAEAVAQTVGNEWDLIHKNLDAIDMGRLKRYNDDLWHLRFKLMTQIEQLNSQIAELQSKNLGVMYGAEIKSLSFKMWDISDHLIPVNDEYAQTSKAIKFKTIQ